MTAAHETIFVIATWARRANLEETTAASRATPPRRDALLEDQRSRQPPRRCRLRMVRTASSASISTQQASRKITPPTTATVNCS